MHSVVGPPDADLGVHLHVGITLANKVMPIMTALLNYYPHLLALSVFSPW